jgi:hypothetical protein
MHPPTRPFLVVYIAWHPSLVDGARLARVLYDHYRRNLYANVAGGTGIPVVYRSEPTPGGTTPLDIDIDDAEASAVVMLIDANWAQDPQWVTWAKELAKRTDEAGLRARIFPVAIDENAIGIGLEEQAARWDEWTKIPPQTRERRLLTNLSYQFCRMLRFYLEHLERPGESDEALLKFLKKVEIFLSHSKHDKDGQEIAKLIRDYLQAGDGLANFFDVYDIPIGLRFNKVLLEKVRVSAVVAIHTDSYSSREWCRREIIEAKRYGVPLVVANCISDLDERGFPYMGNVPLIRMDPVQRDRIDVIIGRLMDEILKDFLWRCWVSLVKSSARSAVKFWPRAPELIALAGLGALTDDVTIVYPEPPIGAEELNLFETVAPKAQLRSMTEWLAEVGT